MRTLRFRALPAMLALLAGLLALPANAAVQTREIDYKAADGSTLKGYFAYDDAVKKKRPGVLVVHEWWGLNDYARRRARELAALGYAALAVDMYGEGQTADNPKDAGHLMHSVIDNPETQRARSLAGLELLRQQPEVDPKRIAGIGYCFGGKMVLDMARQGMDLAGVVSFHGALATATRAEKGKIKARVLVLNGEADGFIPQTDIDALKQEMKTAGADFQFVSYPGAKHVFTNSDAARLAAEHGMDIAYDPAADKDSWQRMQVFFSELFAPSRSGGSKGY
ncbi:MAG: dienelactone hydrolase family protein [Moraxellaceae bacterium]|nr:dienelactone hydrolase family protein [Moraxellaceae bacterium]